MMGKYFIWTKDDVQHLIAAENEEGAINALLEKYSYIREEIMYICPHMNEP